jgi:hypothetical protein
VIYCALIAGLLDDRPPFLGIGLHKRAERLRRLSFARENVPSEIDEPRSDHGIGQRLHDRRIESADYAPWRARGGEKPVLEVEDLSASNGSPPLNNRPAFADDDRESTIRGEVS